MSPSQGRETCGPLQPISCSLLPSCLPLLLLTVSPSAAFASSAQDFNGTSGSCPSPYPATHTAMPPSAGIVDPSSGYPNQYGAVQPTAAGVADPSSSYPSSAVAAQETPPAAAGMTGSSSGYAGPYAAAQPVPPTAAGMPGSSSSYVPWDGTAHPPAQPVASSNVSHASPGPHEGHFMPDFWGGPQQTGFGGQGFVGGAGPPLQQQVGMQLVNGQCERCQPAGCSSAALMALQVFSNIYHVCHVSRRCAWM